jgi:hypothetical protein
MAKSAVVGGETLSFRDISRFSIPIISKTKKKIKIRTFFSWNRLARRIDLVQIFRVPFRITIQNKLSETSFKFA